jgi:hypothetical protein
MQTNPAHLVFLMTAAQIFLPIWKLGIDRSERQDYALAISAAVFRQRALALAISCGRRRRNCQPRPARRCASGLATSAADRSAEMAEWPSGKVHWYQQSHPMSFRFKNRLSSRRRFSPGSTVCDSGISTHNFGQLRGKTSTAGVAAVDHALGTKLRNCHFHERQTLPAQWNIARKRTTRIPVPNPHPNVQTMAHWDAASPTDKVERGFT